MLCIKGVHRVRVRHCDAESSNGRVGLASLIAAAWGWCSRGFRCSSVGRTNLPAASRLRNIADKVPKKEGSCVAEAASIYRASSQGAAQRSARFAPGSSSGNTAAPRRWLAWNAIWTPCCISSRSPQRTGRKCAPPTSSNAPFAKCAAAPGPCPASPTVKACTPQAGCERIVFGVTCLPQAKRRDVVRLNQQNNAPEHGADLAQE